MAKLLLWFTTKMSWEQKKIWKPGQYSCWLQTARKQMCLKLGEKIGQYILHLIYHFQVACYICLKTSFGAQPFMVFHVKINVWFARQWLCKWNSFPYERLCTKTRFETGKRNSEMAYSVHTCQINNFVQKFTCKWPRVIGCILVLKMIWLRPEFF